MRFLAAIFLLALPAFAGGEDCPMHAKHAKHSKQLEVDQRGDTVMGFSHTASEHHFRLTRDGGVIEVSALKADDTATRDAIRGHLREIAKLFATGDFAKPKEIHGKTPPGAATMAERRDLIRYEAVDTENGALVKITTADQRALRAVHQFLRFQISDHRTGDSASVQ